MSVIVIARFTVSDVGKAVEFARTNAEIPNDITAYGKKPGSNRTPNDHRRQGPCRD